jgi:molybdenum cofactor cytidylyltransferase
MTADLPVVEPPFDEGDGDGTVVGVLLAAGESTRFGEANKLLAEWDGAPLVAHTARTLCRSTVDAVVVVVGHEADRVRAAVADHDVTVVDNPDYEAGQATSVRRGVTAARDRGADAVLFALGDMPTVRAVTVDRLVAAFRAGAGSALAAAYEGTRGNPVLFGARHFDALADVTGDAGGRDILLTADDAALVETGDPGVLLDIDRPADLDDL